MMNYYILLVRPGDILWQLCYDHHWHHHRLGHVLSIPTNIERDLGRTIAVMIMTT